MKVPYIILIAVISGVIGGALTTGVMTYASTSSKSRAPVAIINTTALMQGKKATPENIKKIIQKRDKMAEKLSNRGYITLPAYSVIAAPDRFYIPRPPTSIRKDKTPIPDRFK